MPKLRRKPIDLLKVFEKLTPKQMSDGQVRCECPFRENHKDGSGQMSFFASAQKNAYLCFSCNARGNLVNLLTTKFGVNYFDAVEAVNLTEYVPEKKEFELDVMWDMTKAPDEFLSRGYTSETLRRFKVGTCSDGSMLIPYYESFDKPMSLLGYQKRWYGKERRVLNSKGFNKSEYLYNLDHSYSYVVLVEGQSDVWRLYEYGYNACALMGASISKWQIEQLAKFDRVYLALDNDLAGRRLTEVVNDSLAFLTNIMLVPYTEKDPGSITSKKSWIKAFKQSTDYLEYTLTMTTEWDGYLDMKFEALRSSAK